MANNPAQPTAHLIEGDYKFVAVHFCSWQLLVWILRHFLSFKLVAVLTEHFFELSDGGYQVNAFTREKTNELVIFRVQIGHHFYVEV